MLEKDVLVKVTNRDNGTVGYTIPDLGNLHRNFESKETKEIPMEELRKLSYIPGGLVLLKECLVLHNEEAIKELLGDTEPEYFYTDKEVKKLLEEGTMDQFLDCLEFAPDGVIDLVKDLAVKLEISDIRKRDVILKKTGFNVTKAIEINKETAEAQVEEKKTRRSAPVSTDSEKPGRRTEAPKYKVIK